MAEFRSVSTVRTSVPSRTRTIRRRASPGSQLARRRLVPLDRQLRFPLRVDIRGYVRTYAFDGRTSVVAVVAQLSVDRSAAPYTRIKDATSLSYAGASR